MVDYIRDPHNDWGVEGAVLANGFAVRQLPEYDDAWLADAMPLRFVTGIDAADIKPEDLMPDRLMVIPEPATVTFSVRVDVEEYAAALALMAGLDESYFLPPLCERQIPARGQE